MWCSAPTYVAHAPLSLHYSHTLRQDMITADFSHHYLEFGEDSIVLRLPCGIAIDLLRYWDGQPVRFVCCERAKGSSKNKTPWGRVFFCVVVERVDDDSDGGEKLYQRFKE